jgi:hypothetical protein
MEGAGTGPNAEQIMSYQGNAALGGGLSGAGEQAVFNSMDNAMANMAAMQRQVNQHAYEYNRVQYEQKIKDRDTLMGLIAEDQIDVDVLDTDRDTLAKKLDEIKDMAIDNQDLMTNREKYAEFLRKKKEFKELKTNAALRWTGVADARKQMVDNNDPDFVQSANDYINGIRQQDIKKTPDPFVKPLDPNGVLLTPYDPSAATTKKSGSSSTTATAPAVAPAAPVTGGWAVKEISSGTAVRGTDGIYFREVTKGTDPADVRKQILGRADSAYNKMPEQAAWLQKATTADASIWNDANVTRMNQVIDFANREWGYSDPSSPDHIQHIGEKGADGKWMPTQDPREYAISFNVANGYIPKTKTKVPDVEMGKAGRLAAQTSADRARAEQSRAKTRETLALIKPKMDELKAKTYKAKMQGDKASTDMYQKETLGWSAYRDVYDYVSRRDEQNFTAVTDPKWSKWAKSINIGIGDGAQIKKLPATDAITKEMFKEKVSDEDGKSVFVSPTEYYLVKENGKFYFVGGYRDNQDAEIDANGKTTKKASSEMRYKRIALEEAPGNVFQSRTDFKVDDPATVTAMDNVRRFIDGGSPKKREMEEDESDNQGGGAKPKGGKTFDANTMQKRPSNSKLVKRGADSYIDGKKVIGEMPDGTYVTER